MPVDGGNVGQNPYRKHVQCLRPIGPRDQDLGEPVYESLKLPTQLPTSLFRSF